MHQISKVDQVLDLTPSERLVLRATIDAPEDPDTGALGWVQFTAVPTFQLFDAALQPVVAGTLDFRNAQNVTAYQSAQGESIDCGYLLNALQLPAPAVYYGVFGCPFITNDNIPGRKAEVVVQVNLG